MRDQNCMGGKMQDQIMRDQIQYLNKVAKLRDNICSLVVSCRPMISCCCVCLLIFCVDIAKLLYEV